MTEKRTVETHGKPVAGTKVRYLEGVGGTSVAGLTGEQGVIAPLENDHGYYTIGFNTDEQAKTRKFGGWLMTAWEVIEDSPLDGLSAKQKQALTDAALDAATKRGLCGDTKKILADLGLPTERTVKTETITIEVEVEFGTVSNGQVHPHNIEVKYRNNHVSKMTAKRVTMADGTKFPRV